MIDTSNKKKRSPKTVLHFMFKRGSNGCYEKREALREEGKEIPTHRFVSDAPKVQVAEIGYDEALTMLSYHNVGNRKPLMSVVKKYASDILDGEWPLTGESVSIDRDGTLFNGQHRFAALVRANEMIAERLGVTVDQLGEHEFKMPIVVAYGLNKESIQKADMGKSRTNENISKLLGQDTQVRSTTKKLVKTLGLQRYKGVVNDVDMKNLQDTHGDKYIPVIDELRNGVNGHKFAPVKDACCEFAYHFPEKSLTFTKSLVSGTNLQEGDPILMLRNMILTVGRQGGYRGGSMNYKTLYKKTINAIFKWMEGQTLKRLDEYKVSPVDWSSLSSSQ